MLTYAERERETERERERDRERERARACLLACLRLAPTLTKECAAQGIAGLVSEWHALVQCLASVLTKESAAQRRMRLDQTKSLVD